MRARPWAAALALLALLGPSARAQEPPEDSSMVATPLSPPGIPLSSGFSPDPLRLDGQTHGELPLSARAPGCRGYVGREPDHVLRLESRFGFLRLFVTSPGDVTLAVRKPDGRWRCSGRPLLGAPREQGAFEGGVYEVWIGSVRPRERASYSLHVTEFRSASPDPRGGRARVDGGGIDIGLEVSATEGRFRGRRLRPGFLPDPRQDGGFAGGARAASLLGSGCRGYVHDEPGHVLELLEDPDAPRDFDYFRVHVRHADEPVSLVIRTPVGQYLCSSPEEGMPSVEQERWPIGTYRIWVGSRAPERQPRYRIEYTETRAASE